MQSLSEPPSALEAGSRPQSRAWRAGRFWVDLSLPKVMAIVNATPDSFSDGAVGHGPDLAMARCDALLAQGADILDIGGESTRPGAVMPTWREELGRVLPVVRHAVKLGVPVSVDTSRPEVMAEVLASGADAINDVRALQWPGALTCVSQSDAVGVCLMHMRGEPSTMQEQPAYADVSQEVREFLRQRAQVAVSAGIAPARLLIDPGYGFGKSHAHNLELMRDQASLLALGYPVLIGWSRKGTLGHVTGRPVKERLAASLAAALACVLRGARVLRVHDVQETCDALAIWRAAGLVSKG